MISFFRKLIETWNHALTSAVAMGLLGGAVFMYSSAERAGVTFFSTNTFSETRQYVTNYLIEDLFAKSSGLTAYSFINPDDWCERKAPQKPNVGTTKTLLELSILRGDGVQNLIINFPDNQVVAVAIARNDRISKVCLESADKTIRVEGVKSWDGENARSVYILVEGVLGKYSVDGDVSNELIHFQNRLERMSIIAARGAGFGGIIIIVFIVLSMFGLLSLAKTQKQIADNSKHIADNSQHIVAIGNVNEAQDKQLEGIRSQNDIQNKRLEAIELCNAAQDAKLNLLEEHRSELAKISERVSLIIQKLGVENKGGRPMNEFRDMARDAAGTLPQEYDVNHFPPPQKSFMAELEKVASDYGSPRKN